MLFLVDFSSPTAFRIIMLSKERTINPIISSLFTVPPYLLIPLYKLFRIKPFNIELFNIKLFLRCIYYIHLSRFVKREIEAEFYIARSTVTCLVKQMEQKGYIARVAVERDCRLKRLCLLEKGEKLHECFLQNIDNVEKKVREGIDEEDKDEIGRAHV